jgi:FKBP-type peptidyl-prolyl cis-trans isomerase FklB
MKQLAVAFAVVVCQVNAADRPMNLEDETAKINYSVGYQVGGDFARLGVESRPDALLGGIQDAFAGMDSAMTPEEMRTTMGDLGRRVVEQKKKLRKELADE